MRANSFKLRPTLCGPIDYLRIFWVYIPRNCLRVSVLHPTSTGLSPGKDELKRQPHFIMEGAKVQRGPTVTVPLADTELNSEERGKGRQQAEIM